MACQLAMAGLLTIAANAQDDASASDAHLDEFNLPELEVSVSADASAGGLSPAYAGGQVASGGRVGVLGSLDYMETPFTLTSYTRELIENQQAASVGEVLLNDPAVRVARGFGNFQQLYMIRGLPVYSDDMSYNGLYGLLPRQYLATELIERVEVLRGANAFLNGAAPGGSGLGGAVNVVPKRAPNTPLTELTLGMQSGGHAQVAVDVARRFADGTRGLRLSAGRHGGDTAVDGESTELNVVALGADFRGERLRVSADLGYQDFLMEASQPSITIDAGLPIPAAPEASQSIAQPWTYSDERDVFGTLRAEYDLGENLTAWVAGGSRHGDEENSLSNPTVIDLEGNTSSYHFANVREETVVTGEIGLRATFTTGEIGHQLSASATAYQLKSKNAYAFSDFAGFPNNIYDPVAVEAPATDFFIGGSMDNPLVTQRARTESFALADVLSLMEDRLFLIGGLRHQTIETYSYDYNTGGLLSGYSENAVTPAGGILYKLTSRLSVYFNYIEGLTPGDIAPATSGGVPVANVGEVLEPYVTEQYEVGVKFDLGRLGGSLNVFQSEKPIAGVDAEGIFGVVSDQRNQGIELSLFGEPLEGLSVLGGVSLIDTDVDGNHSIGAPTTQLNLGSEWELPGIEGLSVDGRIIYTSSQYADAANTQKVPSWTRIDLGLRYEMWIGRKTEMTVRARVENIMDEDYWASAGGYPGAGYLTVGAPRTLLVSATFSF